MKRMLIMGLMFMLNSIVHSCVLPKLREALPARDRNYLPLSEQSWQQARRWWAELGVQGRPAPVWSVPGIRSEPLLRGSRCRGEQGFWWLRRDDPRLAAGQPLIAWRFAWRLPLVLQAPHQGSDRLTGKLARQWFEQQPIAAAMWNSASRNVTDDQGEKSDLAHREDHLMQAATLGLAEHADYRFVQLHGYDASRREGDFHAVLSHGSRHPSAALRSLASCMADAVEQPVATFPHDVDYLGATRNALVRHLTPGRFLHIEMSAQLRSRLVASASLRRSMWRCVAAWAEDSA